jgi:hypothetical protein
MLNLLIPVVGTLLEKIIPDPKAAADAKLKMLELAQQGQLAAIEAEVKLAVGQMEVNKAEAENPSLFVAGWRPAVGWVCALALAYQYLVRPLGSFLAASLGHPVPDLPGLDESLWGLLFGMLGLGGLRSVEKIKGVAAK